MLRFLKQYILIFLLAFSAIAKAQFYYGLQQEFGKARAQYQPFYWTYYSFGPYQVYFYEGCRDIAKYVAYRANYHLKDLQRKLDYQTDENIQILVYSNQGDFRQTNIGLSTDETPNTGGTTKITGTKLSVYFNGNHADLDRQIRAGLAEVLVNDVMYGGSARNLVKNSTLLVVPDWFKTGLINYLAEPWNTDLDNQINDAVINSRYYNLNHLSQQEATLIGHGLWYYIAETYGESSIANILYMVKVSRNIEHAFLFVLGNNTQGLLYEWIDMRLKNSINHDTTQYLPTVNPVINKPKSFRDYYQLKISPDGNQVIYARNEMSQHRVYWRDLTTGKQKRIAKWGPKIERINDLTYPLLAWHPSGQAFAMIHEKRGIIYLTTYNLEDKDKFDKPITGIEKVKDFAYSPDGKKLVMSAVKKGEGQSDIFVYQINAGGLEQITNDFWDDETPRFVNKGTKIVFASNRTHDTLKESESKQFELPQSKFTDIFMYDYKSKSKQLYRVTDTKSVHETQPSDFYDGYFTYLSDENGIKNRYAAKLDSVISFVDTTEHYRYVFNSHPISNYKLSILEQDVNTKANKIAEVFYTNGKEYMYISPISKKDADKNYILRNTYYRRTQIYQSKKASASNNKSTQPANSNPAPSIQHLPPQQFNNNAVDIDNYSFKSDNNAGNNTPQQQVNTEVSGTSMIETKNSGSAQSSKSFPFPIQRNYYVNFSVDKVVAQLDNSFLAMNYQYFTGYYQNPGLNGLFKIATSDLFEDYRITGGMRIGFNLYNEYFVSVENRKKLWDKQLVLHRLAVPATINGYAGKVLTHDAQYKLKYPISEVASIKGTLYYRVDKIITQSQDDASLVQKDIYNNWAGLKMEYVFDNTRPRGLNLFNGWRLKVFGEYYQGFLQRDEAHNHNLIVGGFDVRHYLKVHRSLIWANRLAGSTSWGTDRLCYYLGGVDNWINSKFNTQEQIKHSETYGFQTIATNMRGFQQNVRNGNNFAVFNSELRWPIFNYLANHPLRSDFLNNFQLIPFVDVGMCWYGTNPFSTENTTNQYAVTKGPVTIIINEKKQPIIVGYGLGLRSRLFGYFIRVDFSWGIDNYTRQSQVTYLSLTTDF